VGGQLVQPHIVDPELIRAAGGDAADLTSEAYPLEVDTVEAIRQALFSAVNEGGTGARASVNGFDVAGKTGTAQVVASEALGDNPAFDPHGWFVGFAPFDAPEIVVGVFIENGGSSSAALPVAQKILQMYFDKKTGVFTRNSTSDVAGLN
jgi:penicillin-binding protein 2